MTALTLPGAARKNPRSTLRWKLTTIILLVTVSGLAVMAVGLIVNNRYFFESTVLRDLSIVADVVGNNSQAALTFGDAKAAGEILAALRADSHIVAGGLYDANNHLFAQYRRSADAASLPAAVDREDGERTRSGHIELIRTIRFNEKAIGRILIRSDTGRWESMLHRFLLAFGALFLVTVTVILILSLRLQRLITGPIAHLNEITRRVSREKNYELRAKKYTQDEIGELVDDFNAMLTEIQVRNDDLRAVQDELQQRVNELNREVRERRNAEVALRDSETRYRVLFENNPMPMWLCEIETQRFVAVNDAVIQHYGYTRDEFLAMSPRVLSQPPDEGAAMAAEDGIGRANISKHRRKDGSLITVEIESHVILYGGRRCEIILAKDVTERLRAEEALRRYSDRLKLLNNLDRAISSSLDIHELFSAYVQGLHKILSFDRTTLLLLEEGGMAASIVDQWFNGTSALPIGARLSLEDSVLDRSIHLRQPVLDNELLGHDPLSEGAVLRQEGIRSRIVLPLVVKNRVIGVLTVASRIPTKLVESDLESLAPVADQMAIALNNAQLYEQIQRNAIELERRVAERTEQLKTSNEELEAFSYSVSHDLRAPLRALDGFSTALLNDYAVKLDEQARHYLLRIRAASQGMGQLIDDLLNLSRVTRSKINLVNLDFRKLAQEVMDEYAGRDPDRRVELVAAADMNVNGDANLLRIALDNLIGNAWKFTRKQAAARIEIGHVDMEGRNVFFVRDNGVGFDMTYADKLFGAFQRLHAKTDFEGTGIGLATVQRIIRRHGGRIWAEAQVGKGATFYFTLSED